LLIAIKIKVSNYCCGCCDNSLALWMGHLWFGILREYLEPLTEDLLGHHSPLSLGCWRLLPWEIGG